MADAGPMINLCFRHQHPEAYDRPEVPMEFPREASVTSEILPEGMNREGHVWPDLIEQLQ